MVQYEPLVAVKNVLNLQAEMESFRTEKSKTLTDVQINSEAGRDVIGSVIGSSWSTWVRISNVVICSNHLIDLDELVRFHSNRCLCFKQV